MREKPVRHGPHFQEEDNHADAQEEKSRPADGGVRRLLDPPSGGAPRPLARADARRAGAAGGARLRQGALYGGDGEGRAGRAAHRGGEGAGRDGRGDGARAGRGADQRVFHRRRRGAPAGAVRPRRGGPDLHQLLRPVAAEQPEKAPPDTRKLPAPVPQGAAPGGTDPLQDRQRQALRVVGRGDSAVRLFPLGGHDGSARGRPCRRDDGL